MRMRKLTWNSLYCFFIFVFLFFCFIFCSLWFMWLKNHICVLSDFHYIVIIMLTIFCYLDLQEFSLRGMFFQLLWFLYYTLNIHHCSTTYTSIQRHNLLSLNLCNICIYIYLTFLRVYLTLSDKHCMFSYQ